MAIHLSLTLLRESKWPRTAFHLLPTLSTNAIPFQEKCFVVALWKLFCAVIWSFFFYGSGCKGDRKVPLLSRMRGKFGLILYSLAYSSLFGQIALLDCSFIWPQRKLTLGQKSVGAGTRQRMGLEAKTAFAYLFISALPLRTKGLCSLLWKGELVWIRLPNPLCYSSVRSWSLELSLEQILYSVADWQLKSRLFSLLH